MTDRLQIARLLLALPGVPLPLNRLIRVHFMARAAEVLRWRRAVLEAHPYSWGLNRSELPWVEGEGRGVRVRILVYRRGRQDPDNRVGSVKPLMDALVKNGLLRDDSSAWVTLEVEEHRPARGEDERTEVEITPLPGEAPPGGPLPDVSPPAEGRAGGEVLPELPRPLPSRAAPRARAAGRRGRGPHRLQGPRRPA